MTRFPPPTVSQVKKLQVMLRQANDQLERTMMEKQNLEDSVKVSNEEMAAKVRTRQTYFHIKDQKPLTSTSTLCFIAAHDEFSVIMR